MSNYTDKHINLAIAFGFFLGMFHESGFLVSLIAGLWMFCFLQLADYIISKFEKYVLQR